MNKDRDFLSSSPLVLAIRALLAGGLSISSAYAELPIPLADVSLSATPVAIATQGQAAASINSNTMTITQTSDQASIDWASFNISPDSRVNFAQPSTTSVALNNIHQADASHIMGTLTANGQIYLVNQNGFVFGKEAQVNVNALVATTLGVSDAVLQKGLTSAFTENGAAALEGNGEVFLKDKQGQFIHDQQGQKIKIQIYIEDGARLNTQGKGGRVIIAAPVINNAGTINTTDGQTILAAAKDKVYLQEAGSDSDIRGLLVEVGTGGEVNNMGKVLAERGNVSLMGFAVNQDGMAKASSSVSLNGSVRLLAREGIQDPIGTGGKLLPKATVRNASLDDELGQYASVQLGKSSVTAVDLDSDKTSTAIDAQKTAPSTIEIAGHDITLQDKALVQAHSGKIAVRALDNPADSAQKGSAQVTLALGSQIDVSGVKDVSLPMSRNIVDVELRKNELKDAPLQRDGVLFGQTVAVDLRTAKLSYDAEHQLTSATIPVADIKGAVDRIGRNIDERSTAGGSVDLNASGAVITQAGSLIDFSGGSVAYQAGTIETTHLVANGQLYDIASADPDRHYDSIYGVITENHPQWGVTKTWQVPGLSVAHFETGYVEGKAGGRLAINTFETQLQGNLDGSTLSGIFQRTLAERPDGSTFTVDLSNNTPLGLQNILVNSTGQLSASSEHSSETIAPSVLADDLFKRAGIRHVHINTNGEIQIAKDAQIELPDHASLSLAASGIEVQGSINAPSGTLNFEPIRIADTLRPNPIILGESARIDVSGRWLNDFQDSRQVRALSPIVTDGGSVTLVAEQGDLQLQPGSVIDASGGARVDNAAQVHSGQGGVINLTAASHESGVEVSNLILGGTLKAYGIEQGGRLSLSTGAIELAASVVQPQPDNATAKIEPLYLSPDFFRQGGFAEYSLTSTVEGLAVADNTSIYPQQQNWQLNSSMLNQATGSEIEDFSQLVVLPDEVRNPTQLSLSFSELLTQNSSERLTVGQGASLQTDTGGQLKLSSDTSVFVEGRLNAPAGTIAITINTPSSGDKGYFASQGIWLGENSQLVAKAQFKPEFNAYGLHTGEMLPGGSVSLLAKRGYIVTQQGALIDVSGGSGNLDLQSPSGVVTQNIAAAGGSIALSAGEGLLMDGRFNAVSGGHETAGGQLSVEISRNLRSKPLLPISGGLFPDDTNKTLPQTIVIADLSQAILPKNLELGGALSANTFSGRAFLNSPQLNAAGFSTLQFKTDVLGANANYAGSVQFKGDVDLTATQQIILDTPTLQSNGGQIHLNTAYAALGSSHSRIDKDLGNGQFATTLAPAAQTGAGQLTVAAQGIDLIGGLSFNGFNSVSLNSAGDIRTQGIRVRSDSKDFLGELKLAGDLNLSASQLYPATLSQYQFTLNGSDKTRFSLSNNGNEATPVYSAGGSLTIKAPNIEQGGRLKAPLGSLALAATQNLTLLNGSLTSVSGDGLTVPFGQGSGGINWLYPLDSAGNSNKVISHPPDKQLSLKGKAIALNQGATVDLSGGGDLYGYEFISGPGGSVDVLDANSPNFVEKYAIIPSLGNALTPYDPQEFNASGLHTGDSVYLSASPTLTAGWYTLLPAHYALLPNAYLLTPQPDTHNYLTEQATRNLAGADIVAGRYGVASAHNADDRWQAFAVEPGSVARTRSQYTDYFANTFFATQARPNDAGRLAIMAQSDLSLGASLLATPANTGLAGQVDISADNLLIVGHREDSADQTGTVSLLAEDLTQLNAPSLLLGGVRIKTQTGQKIAVSAKTLSIAGDAQLAGSEILLAAQNQLRLQSGAVVESLGQTDAPATSLQMANQAQNNSDGALLRVSSAGQAQVTRNQKVTAKTGELIVEAGALLKSSNSMLLDSTKNTVFAGDIAMQGGSLALNASKISLGAAPAGTSGLVLASTPSNLDELKLTSTSDVAIYGAVSVNAGLLAINAAQLNGFDNSDKTAELSATQTIQLNNTAAKAGVAGTGNGRLNLWAEEIDLGSGELAVNGFAQVNFNAPTIKGLGQTLAAETGVAQLAAPNQLTLNADVTLQTQQIIGGAGASTRLDASGHQLTLNALEAATTSTAELGASWTIIGDSLTSNAHFDLPAGELQLTALQGNIDLTTGSQIDVSGRSINFAEHVKAAPAGRVSLSAQQGNIHLASDAAINLAGAVQDNQQNSDAGKLSVYVPNGQFNWEGKVSAVNGMENSAYQHAQFSLDTNELGQGGFSALNQQLAEAGFTGAIQLEQHNGDVTIAATDIVDADAFQLSADQGKVTINGILNINDKSSGAVSVYGRNGISLGASAQINSHSVTLDTVHRDDSGSGLLDLAQAALIDVSGDNGGTVHLRTGRDDAQQTIAITTIGTQILGANPERTYLEATRVYGGQTTINTATINSWQQDTQHFMAATPKWVNNTNAPITLLPGLEIRSDGDLSLANQWDLLSWRYADSAGDSVLPGFLTLNAAGNLAIKASLTDAFATAYLPGQSSIKFQDVLQTGNSWHYHLIAGGDVQLANSYLAPDPLGTGLKVNEQVVVRTGTGTIDMAAGGNIQFIASKFDPSAAAAVYTMGTPATYTRGQLLSGVVPSVPNKSDGETDADYLNRLDPAQMNTVLRYGYVNETLLGLVFRVAEYPTQGGNIQLHAGGTISGTNTGQAISDWLVRSGAINDNLRPTAWGININGDRTSPINGISAKSGRFFNQNIGALGGGQVTVEAGGDIKDLSIMLPTTGKPFGTVSTASNQWTQSNTVINGGGDLIVSAGHQIVGGEFYVGRGIATLTAGDSLGTPNATATTQTLGTILELGEGSVNVKARQDVVIASVFNPTVLKQTNLLPFAAGGESQFFSYGDSSAVNLLATAGNIVLQNDTDAIQASKNLDTSAASGFEYAVYPGSLSAVALSGDIRINHSLTLYPSTQGELTLLAGRNISTDSNAAQLINVHMSDADMAFLPSIASPAQQLEGSLSDGLIRTRERLDASTPDAALIHAATPLHLGDVSKPAIIAKLGDIRFAADSEVTFFLSQAADFSAGRDITNLSLVTQNLASNDVTQIIAGRDIRYDAIVNDDGIVQANDKQIELGGAGQLQIQAQRNINLGGSAGFNTIGNTKNSVLAEHGAAINVLAGVAGQPNYPDFIDRYYGVDSAYLADLSLLDNQGNNVLAGFLPAQKRAYLEQLPAGLKQAIVLAALFSEIKATATAAASAPENQRKTLYQRGFDAIQQLFPKTQSQGDLSLVFSQIKTLAGGGINLVVPTGAVNVGLAGRVAGIAKGANELGIVVQQEGDLNAMTQGDFNVNQSRVFTMGGGDIAVWSSAGNIDAGKGAKSAISAPAPMTSVDAKGNIVTVFPPIVAGSGIQTIHPQGGGKQGNVYLAAPIGIIDAGEAGISGGNVVIAATAVVGAANISASGGSVGVPTAVAPPVVPAGAASAAASAAKSAAQNNDSEDRKTSTADSKKTTVSALSVDVIGYGECSVADVREGKSGCGG